MNYFIPFFALICVTTSIQSINMETNVETFFKNFNQKLEVMKGLNLDEKIRNTNNIIRDALQKKESIADLFVNKFKDQDSNNTLICMGCRSVVNVIKIDLEVMKYSADEIKKIIQSLCHVLAPFKVQREMCDDITNYIDDIIQWILNGTTPGEVCVKLHLCPKPSARNSLKIFTPQHWENQFDKMRSGLSKLLKATALYSKKESPLKFKNENLEKKSEEQDEDLILNNNHVTWKS